MIDYKQRCAPSTARHGGGYAAPFKLRRGGAAARIRATIF